jgi:hypothetical protein
LFQETGKQKILVIQVCNTNSARDDNFQVFLNGTEIDAFLDLNANSKVGAIYISDSGTFIDDDDPLLLCQNEGHGQSSFSPTILNAFPTDNCITTTRVQNNNNGNYGGVRVISYDYPYVRGQGCIEGTYDYGGQPWDICFDLCPPATTIRFSIVDTNGDGLPLYVAELTSNPTDPYDTYIAGDEFTVANDSDLRFIRTDSRCYAPNVTNEGTWHYRVDGGSWVDTGITTNQSQVVPLDLSTLGSPSLVELTPNYTCDVAPTTTLTLEKYYWYSGGPPFGNIYPADEADQGRTFEQFYEVDYTLDVNGSGYRAGNVIELAYSQPLVLNGVVLIKDPGPSGGFGSVNTASNWYLKEGSGLYSSVGLLGNNSFAHNVYDLEFTLASGGAHVLPTWTQVSV